MLDLAIWAQKYILLRRFICDFHIFRCISQTCDQNKKCSLDKTVEENEVLELAISAHKYTKIYMHKINFKPVFLQIMAFLRHVDSV